MCKALIRARALDRAARFGGVQTNRDATRSIVDFRAWLYHAHGVADWRDLSRYSLWNFYLDYRTECVRHGMMYQKGEVYGLTNV